MAINHNASIRSDCWSWTGDDEGRVWVAPYGSDGCLGAIRYLPFGQFKGPGAVYAEFDNGRAGYFKVEGWGDGEIRRTIRQAETLQGPKGRLGDDAQNAQKRKALLQKFVEGTSPCFMLSVATKFLESQGVKVACKDEVPMPRKAPSSLCPLCGKKAAYVGHSHVDCETPGCPNFTEGVDLSEDSVAAAFLEARRKKESAASASYRVEDMTAGDFKQFWELVDKRLRAAFEDRPLVATTLIEMLSWEIRRRRDQSKKTG